MKRSLFRVGAALATLALAGTLAACSNNNASSNDTKPTTGSSAEAEAGPAGFSLEDEEELLEQAARVPARASVARAAPTRNRERFM